uniref:Uncharacterized protein n=1 Tax=Knipowitschia caucasica TaxID=637954 RepID=A0AAV2JLW1_KNICA
MGGGTDERREDREVGEEDEDVRAPGVGDPAGTREERFPRRASIDTQEREGGERGDARSREGGDDEVTTQTDGSTQIGRRKREDRSRAERTCSRGTTLSHPRERGVVDYVRRERRRRQSLEPGMERDEMRQRVGEIETSSRAPRAREEEEWSEMAGGEDQDQKPVTTQRDEPADIGRGRPERKWRVEGVQEREGPDDGGRRRR